MSVETTTSAGRGQNRGLPERIARVLNRDVPLVLCDLVIVAFAYLVPLVLRFDGSVPPRYWHNFLIYTPVVVSIHLLANYLLGLYGQMWRYASVQEARRVLVAGGLAALLALAAGIYMGRGFNYLPISVILLGSILAVVGFGTIRFQSRLFALRRRSVNVSAKRVLLIGAGDAGSMVLKDILQNPSLGLHPVGVIDDDPRKAGRALHGCPVLGPRGELPELVQRLEVDQVLLTIPSATGDVVRDVAAFCETAGVTLRVLPSVREVVGGRVTARDIRDLSIEDLLGRQQVRMDADGVARMLSGRRVLITGAGGSIGSEMARQVAGFGPSALLLLDHDETHLHDVQLALNPGLPAGLRPEPILADVRDQDRLLSVFLRHRPEVVFHAAAHKHVHFLESYPEEAFRTNMLGTANAAEAAMACGVRHFVLISTDKAVHPTSVMGASKWFAEQIVRSYDDNDTVFCAVRFGNVLGSRGSVIPTFLRQIEGGGPVTVTDPGMARYFMSVEEAVQLVLQAASLSQGGEVFTLDMGEPVMIIDLARKLIRLSGRVPDRDVQIAITGTRPGEKLVEELVAYDEEPHPSEHPGIVVAQPPVPDRPSLRRAIWELEALVREARTEDLAARIKQIALNGKKAPVPASVGGGPGNGRTGPSGARDRGVARGDGGPPTGPVVVLP